MAAVSSDFDLTCSPQELFTLAALLGGQLLIGFPDPFPGWLTEEIQEAMVQSQQALVERDYLRQENGEWRMDALVAALIGTLIAPSAVLLVTASAPSAQMQRQAFYARPPFLVQVTEAQEGYHLHPLSEDRQALAAILNLWQVECTTPAAEESFSMPEKLLEQVRQALAQAPAQAEALLRPYGASGEAFLRSLERARRNGALVVMRQRGVWQVGGLGFLESENGLWRLRSFQSNAQDWVECLPCSIAELWQEVAVLLERYFFA